MVMDHFRGMGAIVTGASRGIGHAIATRLCALGARVLFVARSADETAAAAGGAGPNASVLACDITDDHAPREILSTALKRFGRLDILVHAAGAITQETLAAANLATLDEMYRINVRAPVALTQAALPRLCESGGQILFVNSSIIRAADVAGRGGYAATKHALKAIADALRDEINPAGVRVVSIMPGTTATPSQERLHALAGKRYVSERLLQPEDIAQAACDALAMPRTAEMTDVFVRPMSKP